ncbi:MAG TPA: hypothetical protein VED85_02130 [Burkholderiaceae bacterium]|nr:hypothetical protein [Burkholderiaceae bacterium]
MSALRDSVCRPKSLFHRQAEARIHLEESEKRHYINILNKRLHPAAVLLACWRSA